MRHIIERLLTGFFLALSVWCAIQQNWSPANYFLFLAALVDFDDWTNKGAAA